jgi:hypothetical protein
MVDAGPSVLGASGHSGRASRQKMPKIATSKSVCAQNRRGLTDTGRYSLWHIAGVQVRAFGGPYSGRLRRLRRRTESLLTLTMYERRTHPSGQAVCLLGLRRGRFWGGVAGLALLICAAGALSTYAGATLGRGLKGAWPQRTTWQVDPSGALRLCPLSGQLFARSGRGAFATPSS